MLGVELVTDAASKAPHPVLAKALKAACKGAHRVLISSEGPFESVIKVGWCGGHCLGVPYTRLRAMSRCAPATDGASPHMPQVKPPICFSEAQAVRMVGALRSALRALGPADLAALAEASAAQVAAIEERHRRLG